MRKYINKISGRIILIITLIVVSTLSCSKGFLELDPMQDVSLNQALVTASDFNAAITGCYDGLQNNSSYGRYIILIPDVMSDDLKGNAVSNRVSDWHSYSGSSSDRSEQAQGIWVNYYRIIDRCNRILEAETDLDIDEIRAQAYAFRALAYFDLIRIYGQHYTYTADASHMGVPIVLNVDPFQMPARNTVAEVYSRIIDDFTTALGMINDDKNSFYFSENVVKALLSRVYLYKEDWVNAEAMASDVIGSGDYTLVANANYTDIFTTDHSSETIFEIDFNPVDNLGFNALGTIFLASGSNEYLPSLDLYDTIPDGDIRKETLFLEDLSIGGGDFGTLRVYKYPSEFGYDNTPVVRLSELYLTRAEANYHIGTPAAITAAQDDVTLIRQRGLPAAPAVTETGTDLLDEILLERRIELCFEGHRLWDLTRNKMGIVRVDETSGVNSVPYPDDRFILAIGLQETEVNTNIIQNPGY